MARKMPIGNIRLWFLATPPANKAAPTTGEVLAGVDLTAFLQRDGLTTPKKGNTVDIADISDPYNSTAPGTYGGDPITLGLFRDDTTDTAWTTLLPVSASTPLGTSGAIVVRRFGGATTAIAVGNKVEVWPVSVISAENNQTGEKPTDFTVTCAVTSPPNDRAVVA
jgi:hypothetical protein